MADVQKADGVKRGRKHTGLGRGLGALIPPVQDAPSQTPVPRAGGSPLDVFFPEGNTRQRGGSAKELLQPKQRSSAQGKKRGPAKRAEMLRQATPVKDVAEGGAAPSRGTDRAPSAGADSVLPVERLAPDAPSDVSRETSEGASGASRSTGRTLSAPAEGARSVPLEGAAPPSATSFTGVACRSISARLAGPRFFPCAEERCFGWSSSFAEPPRWRVFPSGKKTSRGLPPALGTGVCDGASCTGGMSAPSPLPRPVCLRPRFTPSAF